MPTVIMVMMMMSMINKSWYLLSTFYMLGPVLRALEILHSAPTDLMKTGVVKRCLGKMEGIINSRMCKRLIKCQLRRDNSHIVPA